MMTRSRDQFVIRWACPLSIVSRMIDIKIIFLSRTHAIYFGAWSSGKANRAAQGENEQQTNESAVGMWTRSERVPNIY